MKTIDDIQKTTTHYKVYIGKDILEIDPEIVLKYRLKVGMSIDTRAFHQMIKDNQYIIYYKLAIKKLKRMQTTYDMQQYLLSRGAHDDVLKQIIHALIEKKYLDDELYIKTYIQLKSKLLGPKMMTYQLKEKGVPFDLIDEAMKKLDESEVIETLIAKKLSSLKHKSVFQTKISLKQYLLQKGFSHDVIDEKISNLSFDDHQDMLNLKRTVDKLTAHMEQPFSYETKQALIAKLLQKGFQLNDIKKIII